MSRPAYIIDVDKSVTLVYPDTGIPIVIMSTDRRFDKTIDHINSENWTALRELVDRKKVVEDTLVLLDEDDIKFELRRDGVVLYNGVEYSSKLVSKIIVMVAEGKNPETLKPFISNLFKNPSKRVVDELYGFMISSNLPITESGSFLAYKIVQNDYTDKHTGKMDNSIGKTVKMPRNQVNEDKYATCSTGLHFCGYEYATHFINGSDDRVMILEVFPEHVVSIPVDYNNQKGRACQYKIVGEKPRDSMHTTVLHNYDAIELATKGLLASAVENGDEDYDAVEEFELNFAKLLNS